MVMGLGVIMTGLMPTYTGLVVATLVMSFGFHYYETLNQSLTLQYFDITQSPVVMGRLRAVGSAANIVIGLIFLLVVNHVTYQTLYVTLGIFIMGAPRSSCSSIPPERTSRCSARTWSCARATGSSTS